MKKLLMIVTVALLSTGAAFACDGKGECKKGEKKECCKKGDKKDCKMNKDKKAETKPTASTAKA